MPIELTGMKELLANLNKVGTNVKAARQRALLAGAEVIRDAAEKKCPRGSDAESLAKKYSKGQHLADNIAISSPAMEGNDEYVNVGPAKGDNDDFYYGKFLEFGAAAHEIKIKKGPYKGMKINHPGIKPQPFVEPALIENRDKATEAMAAVIREAINSV